jgi:hypothetical protein
LERREKEAEAKSGLHMQLRNSLERCPFSYWIQCTWRFTVIIIIIIIKRIIIKLLGRLPFAT